MDDILKEGLEIFRSEIKNIDAYIKNVKKFYELKTQILYKQTVNNLALKNGHPKVFNNIEEKEEIKVAAAALNEEIKILPLDMVRPKIVQDVNEFLE